MTAENPPKKLLDQVRDVIRLKHYALSTEEAYLNWIKRFILFHHKRHPRDMGVPEIEAFLTYLAVEQGVAASTQNQSLQALLFLYREVLRLPLDDSIEAIRAKNKPPPTVNRRRQASDGPTPRSAWLKNFSLLRKEIIIV